MASLCFPKFDLLDIDELLEFYGEELFDSPPTSTLSPGFTAAEDRNFSSSRDTADELCVPGDDVMEIGWLSNITTEAFSFVGSGRSPSRKHSFRQGTVIPRRTRSKRSPSVACDDWTSRVIRSMSASFPANGRQESGRKRKAGQKCAGVSGSCQKCTHCSSEKTPQWRAGPMGPKTLCNACGVRYKSGRLLPEYRPAASPAFVTSQHSNSHRRVVELRRQKAGIPPR